MKRAPIELTAEAARVIAFYSWLKAEADYSERMIPTSPDQFDRGRAVGLRSAIAMLEQMFEDGGFSIAGS